jgi:hypothetical protein
MLAVSIITGMRADAARAGECGAVGDLYVCSSSLDQIMQYDGLTGEFVCIFAERPPGMNNNTFTPVDLAWAPNGHLWVTSVAPDNVNSVIEYDGSTGAFIRFVVPPTTAEQGFRGATSLTLGGSTGALYMTNPASPGNDGDAVVYRFEDGSRGPPEIVLEPEIAPEPVMLKPGTGKFASNGNYFLMGLSITVPRPTFREFDGQTLALVRDLAIDNGAKFGFVEAPDGLFYLVTEISSRIDRYDIASGQLVNTFIPRNPALGDSQDPEFYEAMHGPVDIAFGPDGNLYVCAALTWVQGVPPFGVDFDGGGVHVFDPVTGEQVDLIGHMDYFNGLEWQPEKLLQPHGMEFKPMPGDYASAGGAFNGDWTVDLKDFAKFTGISPFTDQPVLAGPGLACKDAHALLSFDFDRDGDLDLADFAAFQRVFGTTFGE